MLTISINTRKQMNNLYEFYVEIHSWNSNIFRLKSGHDFSFQKQGKDKRIN